jgi:phosphatidylglycerol:prolipoprotein diacylglycerol transferase
MSASPYSLLMLAGIVVSVAFWARLAKRDERLLIIYIAALVSAFLCAKIVYLAAEGWMFWDSPERWMIWATGKSIIGALLGGYAGVEIAKKMIGYTQATGDWFAVIAPAGIMTGRIGCLLHGCCLGKECDPHWWTLRDAQGIARWPAVPAEIGFNVLALAVIGWLHFYRGSAEDAERPVILPPPSHASLRLRAKTATPLAGQYFHLYLIGYGAFRFAHEFLRATPRMAQGFSGYQIAALACVGLGAWRYAQRKREMARERAQRREA